ncbi:hypothetical protein QOZ80_7BG0609570 [Eleusine coracana subsp. coracana]|nr:hypothetical protein QOZ80_7BG0609570 [Eleusine coracana subsp. coracana]
MLTPRGLKASLEVRFRNLVGRRDFLPSVLVVEGLAPECTTENLKGRFAEFGDLRRSFITSDNIGGRAGVVVFFSAASCSAAAEAEPAPPLYRRAIRATALGMRNARRCYRHLMNLIGVLYDVSPAVIEDPYFLQRSVLLEGVARTITPRDLLMDFEAQAAVLVRDTEFGDRVGLMVLRDASQYASALAAVPLRGSDYCSCIPARGAHFTRLQILDALDNWKRQQPTAELLRSLIPPQYVLTDSQMDLHFHCVFLRGPGISEAGTRGLFHTTTEELLHMGYVRAIIIRRDDNIGVLVCDDALAIEAAYTRMHRLQESRLGMYDSSLFPLPAGAAAATGEHLLPPFITPAEYTDRVLLLTGLNTEVCDAAKVACFLEDVLELKKIEAVVVYAGGTAVVAVHSKEDAEALLEMPPEKWFSSLEQDVQCNRFPTPPIPKLPMVPAAGMDMNPPFNFWRMINPMALEDVRLVFTNLLNNCTDDNLRGLVRGLSGLAVISQPHDGLLRSNFTDRAVLLMGTGIHDDTSETALRHVLSRYGSLDGLVLYKRRRVGMVIFRSWIAAARLLRKPDASLMVVGIDCHPAPDAGFAGFIVSWIINKSLERHARTPPFG